MKLLLILSLILIVLTPQQEREYRGTKMSKITDFEAVKKLIGNPVPDEDMQPCGEYLMLVKYPNSTKVYYEGMDDTGKVNGKMQMSPNFVTTEINDNLDIPEVVWISPSRGGFALHFRLSTRDLESMPCLPKPGDKKKMNE